MPGELAYDLDSMSKMSAILRLAALLCVILLVLAAVSPRAISSTFGIVVLLWAILPLTVFAWLVFLDEKTSVRQPLAIPTFSPRPPPSR